METKCTYCKMEKPKEPHPQFPWFSVTVHRASSLPPSVPKEVVVDWMCWDCRQAVDTCFRHFQGCDGCQECRDEYEAAAS